MQDGDDGWATREEASRRPDLDGTPRKESYVGRCRAVAFSARGDTPRLGERKSGKVEEWNGRVGVPPPTVAKPPRELANRGKTAAFAR